MKEKRRLASEACSKARILLAGAIKDNYHWVFATVLLATGLAAHFAGLELFRPAFAEQPVTALAETYNIQQAPAGNSYYRTMSESLSVAVSHGGGGTNAPTYYHRQMSESMSVTTVQVKPPNSYSRAMSEQASIMTGMPPSSSPTNQLVRATPAPYSTSSNQRIDERFSPSLKSLGKRSDINSKSIIGGTPYLMIESFASMEAGLPDQYSEIGEVSKDADPDDSSVLGQRIAASFNDYVSIQQSLHNAALFNTSVSAVLLVGTAAAIGNQYPILKSGRIQRKVYAMLLLECKVAAERNVVSKKIGNTDVTSVLLVVLVIMTVSSIVNAIEPVAGQAFAAISYVGSGTPVTNVGNTDLTPTLPTGLQIDDIMVVFYYTRGTGGSVSISSGWTPVYDDTGSGGQIAVWYRFYQNGDGGPTITPSGLVSGGNPNGRDDTIAHVAAWRGVSVGAPIDTLGTVSTNGNQLNIGAISGITIAADSVVIVMGGKRDDWTSVATLSGDSLTWGEIVEADSTGGGDAGMVWDYAINGAGQKTITSKTFTVTGGTNQAGKGVMFSLRVPLNLQANLSVNLGLSEFIVVTKGTQRAVTDDLFMSEGISEIIVRNRTMIEQLVVADSIAVSTAKSLSEQLTVTENAAKTVNFTKTMAEQLIITESISKVFGVAPSEQMILTEQLDRTVTLTRLVSDQLAVSDLIVMAIGKPLSEQFSITDTTGKIVALNKIPSEQLVMTEIVSLSVSKPLTDQLAMTDNIQRSMIAARTLSEQINFTDVTAKTFSTTIFEQLIINESAITLNAILRSLSEQLLVEDTFTVIVGSSLSIAENLSFTESMGVSITVTRTMLEQMTIQDNLVVTGVGLARSVPDQMLLSESAVVSQALVRSLSEQLNVEDLAGRSASQSSEMPEQLTVTDTVVALIVKTVSEQLTVGDSITKSIVTTRTINEQLAIVENASIAIAQSGAATELLSLTDTISASVERPISISEQLIMSESIAANQLFLRSISEQLTFTDSLTTAITFEVAISEQLVIIESISTSSSASGIVAEQLTISDVISGTLGFTRSITENLVLIESASRTLSVSILESLSITDQFTDISIEFNLTLNETLTLPDSVAADNAGDLNSSVSQSITIGDSVLLTLDSINNIGEQLAIQDQLSASHVNIRIITETMQLHDSRTMLITLPPPSPPSAIVTMPAITMTEKDTAKQDGTLTAPMAAVDVQDTYSIDRFDNAAVGSLLANISMPIYDVNIEASSADIDAMTIILPAFKVPIEIDGAEIAGGTFLTPTMSEVPANAQIIIPIDVAGSLGAGNLVTDQMIVSFTPAVDATDFTMMINMQENNPEAQITQEQLSSVPAFYIDVSYKGNWTGGISPAQPSFFAELPRITFTLTENWAEEVEAERDSNNVPLINLFLLDESTGEWTAITSSIESPISAIGNTYRYTATLPHFSTYVITAGEAGGDESEGDEVPVGDGRSRRAYITLLVESLFVSSSAGLVPDVDRLSKELTESLSIGTVQLKPRHERIITIDDVTVAVRLTDIKSSTFGTAVAILNFVFKNEGSMEKQVKVKYWYSNTETGTVIFEGEQTVVVNAGESIEKIVEVPFHSPSSYHIMVEAMSEDGTLATTDISVQVPWLSVYLYILILVAIIVVAASLVYVFILRRPKFSVRGSE